MSWAWEQTVKPASAKLVLLCLADAHNAETGRCFPSAPYIASKTGQDKKTVYAAILKLENQGLISVEKAQGKCPEYTLNPTQKRVDPITGRPENGCTQKRVDTLPENGCAPYPKTGNEPVINQEVTLKSSSQKNSEPQEFVEFAHWMWARIQPITKQNREPNFQTWAKDIRLLVTRDGRDPSEVREVFEWANADEFWRPNILSAAKLRAKFPDLYARMNSAKPRFDADSVASRTNALIAQMNSGDLI